MKKISIFVLVLVLTVCVLSGCRGRNDGTASTPSNSTMDTSNPATSATVPATTDSHHETHDNGIVDDMITKGSEIIDDVLPDGTGNANSNSGNGNSGNSGTNGESNTRGRGMPRY